MPDEQTAAPPGIRPIPIAEFRDKVLALYEPPLKTPQTRNAVRHVFWVLARVPGVKTTADLTPGIVDRYREAQGKEVDPAALRYLRRVFNLAVEMGHLVNSPLGYDPFPQIKHRPNWRKNRGVRGDTLSDGLAARLVAHLKARAGNWAGYRLYSLVCTALYTPFLRSEILYLRADSYDPRSGLIRLAHGRRPGVEFPVLAEHRPSLEGWMGVAGGGWLYPNHLSRGTPWVTNHYPHGANHAVREAGAEVGIPRMTFESLRYYRYAELAALVRRPAASGQGRGRKKLSLPIVLRERDDPPEVLGVPMEKLFTRNEYDTVKVLLEVYPGGLSWGELDERSTHNESRTTVRRLKKRHPLLDSVIKTPAENPHGDCRIVAP